MIVDLSTYRRLTQDVNTVDGDVTDALTDAQVELEQRCQRSFESATRTEVVRLYPTGRVYPKAFPITAVSNSPQAVIDGASIILGYGFQYAQGVNPFVSGFGADTTVYQPQVTLTYTGGYAQGAVPMDLVRAICEIAFNATHPQLEFAANLPSGVNNVRVGDTGYSGTNLSAFEVLSPSIKRVIRRYKRPMAQAF